MQAQTTNVTYEVFGLCFFLAVTWGIYGLWAIREWRKVQGNKASRRGDYIAAFRRLIIALNLWLLPFSFLVRTGEVILGIGDNVIAQVLFFALTGTNVVGSLFAVVSLRYD